MDLKTFISNSLISIIEGVKDAQGKHGDLVNPSQSGGAHSAREHKLMTSVNGQLIRDVQFDVAVTVTSEGTGHAEGSIEFLKVVKIGGGGGIKDTDQSVSRLKFVVPISLPEPGA